MRKKISLMLPLLCAPLAFWACGDGESNSGTSANGSVSESDLVVATFDDLPVCSGKREGATAYVKDEKTAYICEDGKWISEDEIDGDDSSSSVKPGSSSSKKDDPKSSSSVVSSSSEKSSSSVNSSSSIESSSSSSVTLSEVEGSSSSSVIPGSDPESSSSDGNDDGKSSSSSKAKSSSSVESSSSVIASSSSEELVSSSSFNKSSSSSRGFFDMTRDEFLNPKVSYGEMTDKRDYRKYKTVKIGTQVWMAENLNYYYNKGTAKSYCYGGIEANCEVTGLLYTWAAAIDSVALANDADNPQTCGYGKTCTLPTVVQGVCPSGWHLPSYDEWETLFTAVGGSSKAGTALKSQTGWYSQTGDAADRDAYGFSALPAGYRDLNGNIGNAGIYADFWSASQYENDSGSAYNMYLRYGGGNARMDDFNKKYAFSVRCLQNSN